MNEKQYVDSSSFKPEILDSITYGSVELVYKTYWNGGPKNSFQFKYGRSNIVNIPRVDNENEAINMMKEIRDYLKDISDKSGVGEESYHAYLNYLPEVKKFIFDKMNEYTPKLTINEYDSVSGELLESKPSVASSNIYKSGIFIPEISSAMGGSYKSNPVENAGLFLITFDTEKGNINKQSFVGKSLMNNVAAISSYAEEILGLEDSKNQTVFVSKDIKNKINDTTSVALLYDLQTSDLSKYDIENAMMKSIFEVLPKDKGACVSQKFTPLQSQIDNAKERYTIGSGTWMSEKSLNKPIINKITIRENSLNEKLLSECDVDKESSFELD